MLKNSCAYVAAVCLVLVPVWSAAQTTGATIAGTVLDETGAALPGATVTIRHIDTDTRRVVVTDAEGRYQAPALDLGKYDVTVELSGFGTTVREGIELNLGQTAQVNVTLRIGGVQERVVVTETVSLVETTKGGLSAVVEEKQIRDLPLNGRDFSQLTLLQPGVISARTSGRSLDRGMGTQVSVAGARPNQISYVLDGTDVNFQGNQSPGSAAGGMLGVDTVREFQVLVNNYSAEYGRSSGGIVSAVTRSGTNALHGAGFEFHRNDTFDAKDFFDPPAFENPPFTRNQFGGFAGGPILKDRTFFFASYEGLRQERSNTSIARVPSPATLSRTDISPVILPYLRLYPQYNGAITGTTAQYIYTTHTPTKEDYVVAKVDHTVNSRQAVSVRFSVDNSSVVRGGSFNMFANDEQTRAKFVTGEHKWIFSSRLLNVARVAWNNPLEEVRTVVNVPIDESLWFIPGTRFGSLGVSGMNGLGPDSEAPAFFDYRTVQFLDTLTWTTSRHTVKSGISFTRWLNDQDASFTYGGSYSFSSINDFLLNVPNSFEGAVPGSTTDRRWRQNLIGLFVQDDFAVARRLTLNLGLRYEFITTPKEIDGKVAHMTSIMDPAPTPGDPLFKNPSMKNVAPRLGFAWDVFGDGRTSVRGGGGLFYEPILGNVYRTYGNRTPPLFQQANIRRPPFPNPLGGTFVPLNRLDLFVFDPDNPYRLQYNATVQRELLPGMVVTVGYVGSRGYHQIRNIEANQAVPQILADGRYFFPPNPVRRNPNFESMRLRTTDGQSEYNGMVLGVSKRFKHGLQFQASYTLGKSMDDGSQAIGSSDFSNSFQPRYGPDPADNWGPSDFDIRHNFVFSYSYELPLAADARGFVQALAGGWQISGIVTLYSGLPFTPTLGFDRARALPRSGGAGQRPSWAPGFNAENVILGGTARYFDPNAFVLPELGFFGDVPRNVLRGPNFASWDAALFKNLRFGERYRMQLRLEAFNILNRANFGFPSSTIFNSGGRLEQAGEITGTVGTMRQFQLGIKFDF